MHTSPTLPFLSGVYSTGPGLVPLAKNGLPDNRIFDIDEQYEQYLANKNECRSQLPLHFCTKDLVSATEQAACVRVARELARSYPAQFTFTENEGEFKLTNNRNGTTITWTTTGLTAASEFHSLFDAISNQVQEDLAIFQVDDTNDWLAAIHLCSPNHWDPRDKIGRPFPEIHAPVPAMERTVNQYKPMLKSVISKGPFARYAWGVDKDNTLNHHPSAASQKMNGDKEEYFIRMERQHLVGLPQVNAFLFTIRTYFLPVDGLNADEREALASAIRSMTLASLKYKRMDGYVDELLKKLSSS